VRAALVLLGLGALAPMIQGAAAAYLPARFVPDLSLLLVFAIGLHWGSALGGLVLAALLGFVADLLSGSLLGQHALLRMLAFGGARVAAQSLNLRGALPQATFVTGLTLANAAALAGLTAFFTGGSEYPLLAWRDLLPQSVANAVAGVAVAAATGRLLRLVSEDDGRRTLRLDPRGRLV
jgi:rod shape-determining protein MreD